jgi:glutamine synthetase
VRGHRCPLALIRIPLSDAKATSALSFLVGFETEFVLLKLDSATHVLIDNPIEAANKHGYCVSAALLAGSKEAACLEEIAGALNSSGVDLQMYHAELAPGQVSKLPVHALPR